MMGDVSKEVEREILKKYRELDVDILKVGHHGSNTSTSEELLKIYNPKIGIISCGKNNYYNHPSKEVLLRLEKYNVEIRRTDIEGTIKL
jgi:competence protein ComEC